MTGEKKSNYYLGTRRGDLLQCTTRQYFRDASSAGSSFHAPKGSFVLVLDDPLKSEMSDQSRVLVTDSFTGMLVICTVQTSILIASLDYYHEMIRVTSLCR